MPMLCPTSSPSLPKASTADLSHDHNRDLDVPSFNTESPSLNSFDNSRPTSPAPPKDSLSPGLHPALNSSPRVLSSKISLDVSTPQAISHIPLPPSLRTPPESPVKDQRRDSFRRQSCPPPSRHGLALTLNGLSSPPSSPTQPSPGATLPPKLYQSLLEHPLFRDCTPEGIHQLASRMHIRHYYPQDHIIRRSEQSSAMFYVLRGTVKVASHDNEATYYEIKENNFFGDVGVLYKVPRSMDVLAKNRCTIAILSGDDLVKVMEQSPEMARAIGYQTQERYQMYLKRRQSVSVRRSLDNGTNRPDFCQDDSRSDGFAKSDVHGALRKVPLFQSCSPEIIHMISLKVEPRTYNLGESIIQRGEIGREMFFIISGMVEILSDDNLHVLARFHDGQFFGEIAVLLDVPRIANVKAVSDVEVFVLTKDNLEAVFEAVPGAAEIITAEGNRQYKNWIIRNSRQHLSDQEMNGEEVEEQDFDNESLNIPRSLSVPTIEQSASLMEDEATSPSVRSFDQDSMHSISPRPIHPIEAGHPSAISVLPMTPTDDFSLGHRITASPLVASPAEPAIENFDGPSATEGTSTILEEPVFDQDVSIAPTTENVLDSPTIRNPTIRGLKESNPKRRRASVAVWTQQDLLKLAEAAGAKSQVDTSHSPATSSAIARLSRAMADTTGGQTPTSPHKLSQESRGSSDVSVQMKMAPKKLTGPATFQDLDECIVVQILDNLALDQLLKARRVCRGWNSLILENSGILRDLDLSKYKKFVTDSVLADLCNTVLKSNRTRTTRVSLRDCFLVSDKGLSMLAAHIPAVQDLDLHSCWNVSDAGFRSLGVYCPQLRSIDFSNCRKLGDETIYGLYPKEAMTESSSLQKQHVVENVLGSQAEDHPVLKDAAALHSATAPADTSMDEAQALLKRRPSIEIGSDLDEQTEQLDATSSSPSPMDVDPATIPQQSQNAPHGKTLDVGAPSSGPKGCPYLARLNLSYCKNLTDKSFIHLSLYGSKQLEYLNLQRCTTISSEAFVSLDPSRKNMVFQNQLKDSNGSVHEGYNPLVDPCFPNLRELHLSDCTFLTDEAIVALAPNMPHLQVASLSFCCALTDVAVEALSENCLFLKRLDLSFCGSAVSDASLYKLARFDASEPGKHSLEELEIRGCVRVTERGVREVLSGCVNLKRLNVSSCSGIGTGELQEQGKQGDAAPPSNQTETVEQTNGWVPLQAGHSSELTRKMNALKKGKEWALAQQRPGLVIVV